MIARRRDHDLIYREKTAKYQALFARFHESERKIKILSGHTFDAPAVSTVVLDGQLTCMFIYSFNITVLNYQFHSFINLH